MLDFKRFRANNNLTQNDVAKILGCNQSFVSQIENGSRPIPPEFISKLLANFSYDTSALQYKSIADMSTEDANIISSGKVIPYYDAEVAAGTSYEMDMIQTRQVGMIEIGGLLKDSEFALRVYGDSMTPNYPAGCVIGLKEHTDSFIEPGTVFVIETTDNRYIKRLYYNADKTAFRCISDNIMKHDDGLMKGEFYYQEFEIPMNEVRRLLRVTGVVKRNIL